MNRNHIKELCNTLATAVEAAGFELSGPTDQRAAEHGEPAWVCKARELIAEYSTPEKVVITLAGEDEVTGASVSEDQLQYLLATHATLPVEDQHGRQHRLMTDMDGESLVLLPPEGLIDIRLVLDVCYASNGVQAQQLIDNLAFHVEQAIESGMLTGTLPAEVENRVMTISLENQS
ncbi:hypothetical protein [Gulbenkiania mobilis]|uniref:hypothetical protein n=1 Tax=Gulbenkiania mobilis TaxID=397457 RepID=UPI00128F2F1B|nr:hypothetical protein [Gulbenkiania mobilis]